MNPGNLKYTNTHEWARVDDGSATVGISDYAQSELGEIVYAELPKVGAVVQKDDALGTIESYKTVSDLLAPVSGEVIAVNTDLVESPQFVNESPYEKGWLVVIKMSDPNELEQLMNSDQYDTFLQEH